MALVYSRVVRHRHPHGLRELVLANGQRNGRMDGKAGSVLLAFATIVIWGVTGPLFHYSDTWQLVINTNKPGRPTKPRTAKWREASLALPQKHSRREKRYSSNLL